MCVHLTSRWAGRLETVRRCVGKGGRRKEGEEEKGEEGRGERSMIMMTVELSVAAVCSVYLCTSCVTCENCKAAPQPLTAAW